MPTLPFAALTPRDLIENPKSSGRVDNSAWVMSSADADDFWCDQLLAAIHHDVETVSRNGSDSVPRNSSGLHRPRWFAQEPKAFGRTADIRWTLTPPTADAEWRELRDAAVLQHHLALEIGALARLRGWDAATLAEVTETELDTVRNYLFGSRAVGMRWIARGERHLGSGIWKAAYAGRPISAELPLLFATHLK